MIAIEIKRAATIHPGDLRALREFKSDYAEASCYLFHGGAQPLFLDGIRIIPIRDALRGLEKLLLHEAAADTVAVPRQ